MQVPIPIFTGMDKHVKYIHDLALEWATAAGLAQEERIGFAKNIVHFCANKSLDIHQINFSVRYHDNGRCLLKATLDDTVIDEVEIPSRINNAMSTPSDHFPELEYILAKNKQLEQSNQDLKQFSFAIAHDLKNSLTKLKLAIALLEEEDIPASMTRYVQIIDKSARQIERTTLSLNDLIELGHSAIGIVKKISLAELFNSVCDEFEESLSAMNASVSTDFSQAKEFVYVEIYLKSMFSNLLSNSIKYSSPDRALQINVRAYREGPVVIITFTDNGQGIDLINFPRQKLFQPFTRFSDSTEGKGLGLYIIKIMIERNGGNIEVDSILDQGTTFRFMLTPYSLPEDQ
jgi:two-component system CheB/CheR fusion protein